MLAELRFAARMLLKSPGFSTLVIVTLALGIGMNAAIFGVFHAVALQSLPYLDPARLVAVWESVPRQQVTRNVVSSGNYLDWRDRNEVFESVAAFSGTLPVALAGAERPQQISVVTATPSMFHTLGVLPALGELIPAGDASEAGEDWLLLSDRLWRSAFGADPAAVGRSVRIEDRPVRIAGVMPPDFAFPGHEVQAWLPQVFEERDRASRKGRQWKVVGRLKPGVDLPEARAHLRQLAEAIRAEHPAEMDGWSVEAYPLHEDFVDGYTTRVASAGGNAGLLHIVMVLVGLILLIACSNVAGLLLARTAARRRELATRAVLGASRGRLMAGVFMEAVLYGLAGTGVGLLIAHWALAVLIATGPADLPRLHEASISGTVLIFSVLVTLATVSLTGLLPALAATRENPAASLAGGPSTIGSRTLRWQRALVVTEVALACVLAGSASLLTHSLIRLLQVDPGYELAGVQLVTVPLPPSRYQDPDDQARFHERVVERLGAMPGVAAVAGTAEPPVIGHQMTFGFVIEGRRLEGPDEFEIAQPVRAVTSEYFHTLGIPRIRGRSFGPGDRAGSRPVAVVNRSFARLHWGSEDAIGRRLSLEGHEGPWIEVVGVVGDTRHNALDHPEPPVIYLPYVQKPWWWMSWMHYLVRLRPGVELSADALRESIWAVDGQVAIGPVQSVESLYAESRARRRFNTLMVGAFGALAIGLTLVGIYGVLANGVVLRRGEFGLRMAVGAERAAIYNLVLAQGMKLAMAGLAVGLVLALGVARALQHQLFAVSTVDPWTFVSLPVVIVGIALLGSVLPARRAARLDPMDALRHE